MHKNRNHSEEHGQLEGEVCRRGGCAGVIAERPVEGCTCHITPPCGACTAPREFCPECGWEAVEDEEIFNDFAVRPANPKGAWASYRPRPLDPTKIDWRSFSHSNASMVKEGTMPFGTTMSEVRALVDGTFGGRFEYWREGKDGNPGAFKFIAYTD